MCTGSTRSVLQLQHSLAAVNSINVFKGCFWIPIFAKLHHHGVLLSGSANTTDSEALTLALQVERHESCEIILQGRSEFEATNVTLKGTQRFEVPDGYKLTVTAGAAGSLKTNLQALTDEPSWEWKYTMADQGNIQLQMLEQGSMQQRKQVVHDAAALSYII